MSLIKNLSTKTFKKIAQETMGETLAFLTLL